MRQQSIGELGQPEENGQSECTESVLSLLDEAVALYFRLRAVAEDIHGHSELSGAMRGVLRDLRKFGPQTVPQMARRRPVTRQHIQAIVNDLQQMGLVELSENPAHKRSKLVRMTPSGERTLQEIVAREEAILSRVDMPVSVAELESAHRALAKVRETMESKEWRYLAREMFYQEGETRRNPWLDEHEDEHFGNAPVEECN